MRVFVGIDTHFVKYEGKHYSVTTYGYSYWKRYLSVFDEVVVVARVRPVNKLHPNYTLVDNRYVKIAELPDFTGPSGVILFWTHLWSKIREIATQRGSFILRVPGIVGTLLCFMLRKFKKPYALEVAGDPCELFNIKSIRAPWAVVAKLVMPKILRIQCRNAIAVAYVTKNFLQSKYPTADGVASFSISSVELPESLFEEIPDFERFVRTQPKQLIFVGSLARPYKGVDVLLKAVALCAKSGMDINLTIIGDGKYRGKLERLAKRLHIDNRVNFWGKLPPGMPIFKRLREADLFVLPSFSEGLPRALLEAMACGLPCIGTRVGGIPEVLPHEALVSPGDVKGLANKINEVLNNPLRMVEMAKRNYEVAKGYRSDILQNIRKEFYQTVEKMAKMWPQI